MKLYIIVVDVDFNESILRNVFTTHELASEFVKERYKHLRLTQKSKDYFTDGEWNIRIEEVESNYNDY
jgi:hypothetical protein